MKNTKEIKPLTDKELLEKIQREIKELQLKAESSLTEDEFNKVLKKIEEKKNERDLLFGKKV